MSYGFQRKKTDGILKITLKAAIVVMGIMQNKQGFYNDIKEREILERK